MIGLGFGDPTGVAQCSAAGCHASAAWTIGWRNPRIHAEDRVKEWAACDEHRDHLRDWLASRDFPVAVAPFGDAARLVL